MQDLLALRLILLFVRLVWILLQRLVVRLVRLLDRRCHVAHGREWLLLLPKLHLDEFGLLLQAKIHLEILRVGPEGIFVEVLDADEGLFLRQVVLGVFVPNQVLNGIRDKDSSLLVSAIFEFDYACLEVILGELPAELAQCIIARSVDLRINRLQLLSPLIVIL